MNRSADRKLGKKTLALVGGMAIALVLGLYLLRERPVPERVAPRRIAAPVAPATQAIPPPKLSELELPKRATVESARLIGEVDVEKSTVCPGEDYKVSVRRANDDPGILFNIDGALGDDYVLRGLGTEDEQHHWVVATDGNSKRDYRKVTVRILSADDERCQSMPLVEVTQGDDLTLPDGKHFEAIPLNGLSEIRTVEWSFGDGDKQTARGPGVSHGYGARPQETETVSFLVTAFVTDVEGRHAYGRTSVSFRNTYYLARRYMGDRPQPVEYDRFQAGSGTGRVPVRVTNIDSRPIEFKRAVVTMNDCKDGVEPTREELPATELVEGFVEPGETKELVMELSGRWVRPGTCRLGIELIGDTIPPSIGTQPTSSSPALRPVKATFQFELHRPLTVAEGGSEDGASELIEDPELQSRIIAAMNRLGRGYVVAGDLDHATD